MLKNSATSYGLVGKTLHWVMGLAILGVLIAGFLMTGMDPSDKKWQIYGLHKATGLVILILVAFRWGWRLINQVPALPKDLPQWQAMAATGNIHLLYILMFVMPLSGLIMSLMGGHPVSVYGLFTIEALAKGHPLAGIAHTLHEACGWVIAASISLHFLGALYHHFIRKDNVLRRIWFGA